MKKLILTYCQLPTAYCLLLSCILYLASCILCPDTFAIEQTRIDSLENILNTVREKEKPKILNELSKEYKYISPEKSREFATQALKLARKLISLNKKGEENLLKEYIAEALYNIGVAFYYQGNYEKALKYYESSLKIYKELAGLPDEVLAMSGKKGIASLLNNIGTVRFYLGEYEKALKYFQKSLKISKKLHTENPDDITIKKQISISLGHLGFVYSTWGKYEKAINYYQRALKICEEIQDKKGIAATFVNIGIVYYYQSKYEKTLEFYIKSLKMLEELGDKQGIAASLCNIGNVYFSLRNYDKAIEYFQKALIINKELGYKSRIADVLNNIGSVYFNESFSTNDVSTLEKAQKYFQKALNIQEELGHKGAIANSLNNIGVIYSNWAILSRNPKKYKKAIEYYEQSLKIKEELDDKKGIATSLQNIGLLYFKLERYEKALEYFSKSISIAKPINLRDIIIGDYEGFSETYSAMGNYKKAYEYYKQYTALKDSVFNEESSKQIAEMQTKYETEKKEKEIILLNKEKEVKDLELTKRQAEIKKQRILIYSSVSGFIVILIFSVLLYRQFDQKKKANILLAQQNVEINQQKEEITVQRDEITAQRDEIKAQRDIATKQRDQITEQKKEITDSILYAKHIQSAILPPVEYINKILPKYFILNKPRDIVSGDFYWITAHPPTPSQREGEENSPPPDPLPKATALSNDRGGEKRDGKVLSASWRKDLEGASIIIAAVDCTGHGVPGAFMSMLGISFLNEITSSNISLQANVILNKLRESVMKSLHQTGKKEEAKDGMDIALCILNMETNELQYAGANNPLYIVRLEDERESEKVGNRQSAVGNKNKSEIPNTNSLIQSFNHSIIEIKADRMPIGIQIVENIADLPSFTNHEIKLSKGDTIYLFSDGFVDQFGGPNGKKFKSKQFRQLLFDIHKKDMTEQKDILDRTFEDWKGNLEQVDDVLVMGIRV